MESTYLLAKGILKPWLATWFRWTIEGLANIPARGPAIVAFNHIAYLDPFASAYVVDAAGRIPRYLAKQELFDDRRIGWLLRGAKQIPVKRGTRHAAVALDRALQALDDGEVVVVFPEGTITTDPDLNPMRAQTGTARLALRSGAPLIPAALWGTANVWPKGYRKHWWPPGQDILAHLGEAMVLSGEPTSAQALRAASDEIMDRIGLLLAGIRSAVPDRRRVRKPAA